MENRGEDHEKVPKAMCHYGCHDLQRQPRVEQPQRQPQGKPEREEVEHGRWDDKKFK